jgi:hypothetical protein
MNSKLVEFFTQGGMDNKGRTLRDILSQSDEWLEATHDWVQWVFPIPEPSRFNKGAPIVGAEDYRAIRKSDIIDQAVERFTKFLKLREAGKPDWFVLHNHNAMRASRCLRFLDLMPTSADALKACHIRIALRSLAVRFPDQVNDDTLHYWRIPLLGRELPVSIQAPTV